MVRRKRRYLLVYSHLILNKEKCKNMNLYYIEGNTPYFIVRCYLDEINIIKERLKRENIEILDISGTLKSLRDRNKVILKPKKHIY